MGYDLIISQGDLLPALELQLQNADGSVPDLTGATVECRVQPSDRSRQASVTVARIVDSRKGVVAHDWSVYETHFPGPLLVEFRRTDGANVQTWPPDRSLVVIVNAGLTPPSLDVSPPSPPPGPVPFSGVVDTVNTTGAKLSAVPAASFGWGVQVFVIEKKAFFHIEIGQGYPVDHSTVETALGLAGGQWVKAATGTDVSARPGSNLAAGATTVQPTTDAASIYTLPLATLVANGSVTLGHAGTPVPGAVVQIIRRDLSANTYAAKNWDGTVIKTFAAAPTSPQGMSFVFDGTNYVFLSFYYVA